MPLSEVGVVVELWAVTYQTYIPYYPSIKKNYA